MSSETTPHCGMVYFPSLKAFFVCFHCAKDEALVEDLMNNLVFPELRLQAASV